MLLALRIQARERLRRMTLVLALCFVSHSVHADDAQHEFLFFPSVATFYSEDHSSSELEDSFVRPSLGVLYSYSGDRFRVLGEYLWSSTESELERL